MENPVKKYQLEQDGKSYTLSTQIFQDNLRFVCIELNPDKPLVFIGQFSLPEITKLSSVFASISTITDADEIFDKLITTQNVSLEKKDNSIFIKIIIKQNQMEESFSFNLNLFTNNDNADNQQTTIENQNQSQNQITSQHESINQFVSFAPSYPTNENINFSNFSNIQQQSSQYTESIQTQTQNNTQNQSQPNENIIVNATQNQNQNQLNENIMLNAISNDYSTYNNYNYENVQTYKTKTKQKKIEKIIIKIWWNHSPHKKKKKPKKLSKIL